MSNHAYHHYWGKAQDHSSTNAHLLVWHNLDVAAVGHVLLTLQPERLARFAQTFGLSSSHCKNLIVFLLGLHDIGKFAESFQQLRPDLRHHFFPDQAISHNDYTVRHDELGWIIWKRRSARAWRRQYHPIDPERTALNALDLWMKSVAGHHGSPPGAAPRSEKGHFTQEDECAVWAFASAWAELCPPPIAAIAEAYQSEQQAKPSTWPLAGFAVLCDWLGSQADIFTPVAQPMPLEEYWQQHALPKAQKAVERSGLQPSHPASLQSFEALFSHIHSPTPLQRQCSALALSETPQLIILEDVTGAGKTEAALMLVHRLLHSGLADGLYIGLPTMATANAMYQRMIFVYQRLFDSKQKPSLILSHGARHLSELFRSSICDILTDAENYAAEESVTAQCNRWLADNRKKALLADVGVGTIDQALLSVMPAKHQSLRLLGLYGKILVLDEVHAYDIYTETLLHTLLSFHAQLGGSALLLSATLTAAQKQKLVRAFSADSAQPDANQAPADYPLITHCAHGQPLRQIPVATRSSVARRVSVALLYAMPTLIEHIIAAVNAGRCVCWVRNTVTDVHAAYQKLRQCTEIDPDKLHIFHSRFAMGDRLDIEASMLTLFGKDSQPQQRSGRVLIASQVVEQSLDLDFDLMLSDLAPIDLLIQRAGRLQRHVRDAQGRRADTEQRGGAHLLVYSPKVCDNPDADWFKAVFPAAHFVYSHTLVLWRSARWLAQHGAWQMPEDARPMLETVYASDADVPQGLQAGALMHEGECYSLRDIGKFSSLNFQTGYDYQQSWDKDTQIQTRLGDQTLDVYLARWQNGALSPWYEHKQYPWDMSCVRIRKTALQQLAPLNNPALCQALAQLHKSEPRFDEQTLILPLVLVSKDTWHCPVIREDNTQMSAHYSCQYGFELHPHKCGEQENI